MSFLNGLSAMGQGVAAFAGSAGLEQQRTDAATALQRSGGDIAATAAAKLAGTQSDLVNQKATLEQQQAVLADQLARATGSFGRQEAGTIAATAATAANTFHAGQNDLTRAAEMARTQATEAGATGRKQMEIDAPSPEIKSAKQFSSLSPAEKQAYREEMMTKAGIPAWMIGGDNPSPPTGSGTATPSPADGTPPVNDGSTAAPVTGATDASRNDKALESVPGPAASIVKGMVDGRIAPPSSFAMSKPYWQGMIAKAAEYDPTFDQTTWAGRVATRKDFASGKSAQAVTALNTALSHAGTLVGDFDALNNGSFTPLNAALNMAQPLFGDSRQGKAQETVDALASEARKVFAASGGGNLTELQEWQKNFPLNGSPTQQKAALTGFVELLDGRLQGLADQYNRGMGRTDDPLNLLQPKARAVYEKLTGRDPENATGYQMGAPPAASAGSSPKISTPAVAPADPTAREVGKSYPLPNGKTGVWRGTGWEVSP